MQNHPKRLPTIISRSQYMHIMGDRCMEFIKKIIFYKYTGAFIIISRKQFFVQMHIFQVLAHMCNSYRIGEISTESLQKSN